MNWEVLGSGKTYMSLSQNRVNPSTEEPSNQMPLSSASWSSAPGMVTFLMVPITSVNCRLTNLTWSCSPCSITCDLVLSMVFTSISQLGAFYHRSSAHSLWGGKG